MNNSPEQRRHLILQWLRESTVLTIEEIVNRLDVSLMTVHRDLDHLTKAGLAQKTYGRVELIKNISVDDEYSHSASCAMCRADIPFRTRFVIHLTDGKQLNACCPHCGLMLMHGLTGVVSALTRDFIYCRMINARQAVYVVESRVHLCCVPGVLCFTSIEDATCFVSGFNGEVMDFDQTSRYLIHSH